MPTVGPDPYKKHAMFTSRLVTAKAAGDREEIDRLIDEEEPEGEKTQQVADLIAELWPT